MQPIHNGSQILCVIEICLGGMGSRFGTSSSAIVHCGRRGGHLTNAAERRLHTTQPPLSRQIRDLELEIGVKLLERKTRGIALTAAGRVFLDHVRLALMQIEVACDAARGTEQPERKPEFQILAVNLEDGGRACKPDSVRRCLATARDDHSSSPSLATGIQQPTRGFILADGLRRLPGSASLA
jgi:Bacterial regulatory helix-turn-helix protein, lysR family